MSVASVAGARCPFCGQPATVVWVHGHGQCARCGVNREPCCDGAPMPASNRRGARNSGDDRASAASAVPGSDEPQNSVNDQGPQHG